MRKIPDAMQAALDTGVTTHCRCVRAELTDGRRFAFTDHDRDLTIDGEAYRSGAGFSFVEMEARIGLAAGQGELAGCLNAAGISESALSEGAWDGARIEIWQFDWRDTAQRVKLISGRLGEVSLKDGRFEAQWLGPAAALETRIGRQFTRECDAELGDERCAIPSDHAGFALGCDKRFATCRERFANTRNFRGFPYMPGNDVLIAGAPGETRRDGASRGLGG